MTKISLLPFAATLCLSAGLALAQDAPPPGGPMAWGQHRPMDEKAFAEHHKAMCADHYAMAVGGMAALETRLNLTAAQKPLFARWKDTVLASAKQGSEMCAAMKPPRDREHPSVVEALRHHEKQLQSHLEALRAQMPALEALNSALDDSQKRILAHGVMMAMHHMHGPEGMGPHGMGPRGMGPHGPHGMEGPHGDGPDGPDHGPGH